MRFNGQGRRSMLYTSDCGARAYLNWRRPTKNIPKLVSQSQRGQWRCRKQHRQKLLQTREDDIGLLLKQIDPNIGSQHVHTRPGDADPRCPAITPCKNNVQRSLGVQRSRPRVLCRRNFLFHWRAATHQVPLAAGAPLQGLTAAQQEGQMRWAQIAPACGHNALIVGLNSKQLRNYRELRRSRATPSNQLLLIAQRRSGIGNA